MNYLLTQTFGYLAITIILPIPHILVCATNTVFAGWEGKFKLHGVNFSLLVLS